jgi:hypothetical protein
MVQIYWAGGIASSLDFESIQNMYQNVLVLQTPQPKGLVGR